MHRDCETSILVFRQQTLGQSPCFSSEHEKIPIAKIDIIVRAPGLRCQKKITRSIFLRALQFLKRIPYSNIYFVPIIETGAFQFSIIERKAERFDQMESRSRCETKTTDVARVRRNLRLNQNNV